MATGNESAGRQAESVWERYTMALDEVGDRLRRVTRAFNDRGLRYAVVGGQAVAIWVASRNPAAVRTTKDVDILLARGDLPVARAAALSAGFDYCEVLGVGMLLERAHPDPRRAVHLVWAGEKVRPEYAAASPAVDESRLFDGDIPVVSLAGLVRMKLAAHRDQDRVHLRDMIEVDLVGRDLLADLPAELAARLDALLTEAGR